MLDIVLKQFKAFLQSCFKQLLNSEAQAAESPLLVSPINMAAIVPALSGSGSAPDVALNTYHIDSNCCEPGGGGVEVGGAKHNLQPAASSHIQKTWKQVGGHLTDGNIITGLTVNRSTLSHSRCLFIFQPLSDLTDVERLVAEVSPKRKKKQKQNAISLASTD